MCILYKGPFTSTLRAAALRLAMRCCTKNTVTQCIAMVAFTHRAAQRVCVNDPSTKQQVPAGRWTVKCHWLMVRGHTLRP